MKTRYPIYIPSKGRWNNQLTSRALDRGNIPHNIIVEEQEYDLYLANKSDTATLIVLDKKFREIHETLDDLGDSDSYGAGPARNQAWELSIASGAARHWDVDDNIDKFYRLHKNRKVPCDDAGLFVAMEDFADRYENVGIAGPNYSMFVYRRKPEPPFIPNTRIYSCSLIMNSLPFRWRLRMNEDTDLSLRVLKAGYATIQFNAFLQGKMATQSVPGGYTQEFYAKEGTLRKSKMLVEQHPDVAEIAWRFGRWHHYVDYAPFKNNKLIRKKDYNLPEDSSFGLVEQKLVDGKWVDADPES
jgi:hypothetical protein